MEINRAMIRLLENPALIAFVCNPDLKADANFATGGFRELTLKKILAAAYPFSFIHPIVSLENYLVRKTADSADLPMIVKYLPLIFAYDPPTAAIRMFMSKIQSCRKGERAASLS